MLKDRVLRAAEVGVVRDRPVPEGEAEGKEPQN